MIGGPDVLNASLDSNRNAIDLEVRTVAASAGTGIYLEELAVGVDLVVDHVDRIASRVDVRDVNFNSTTTGVQRQLAIAALDDLTAGGPIKVVVDAGNLTINAGTDNDDFGVHATTASAILLEARGPASDLTVSLGADVVSAGGHITLIAEDDVRLVGDVLTSASSSMFVQTIKRLMSQAVSSWRITRLSARMVGRSLLRRITKAMSCLVCSIRSTKDFLAGAVSIRATGSVLDGTNDLAELNIQTGRLRIEADSNNNQVGSVGLVTRATRS